MGTKNNPGAFDCYANAEPDEPMFVLLGRDPLAGLLVRLWAAAREAMGEDAAKVAEARACADAMILWAGEKKTQPVVEAARKALIEAMVSAVNEWDDTHAPAQAPQVGALPPVVMDFLRGGLTNVVMQMGAKLGAEMVKARAARPCPKCGAVVGQWCNNNKSLTICAERRRDPRDVSIPNELARARSLSSAFLRRFAEHQASRDHDKERADYITSPCRRCQKCGYLTSLSFTHKVTEKCLDGGEHDWKDFPNGETAADLERADELIKRPRMEPSTDTCPYYSGPHRWTESATPFTYECSGCQKPMPRRSV